MHNLNQGSQPEQALNATNDPSSPTLLGLPFEVRAAIIELAHEPYDHCIRHLLPHRLTKTEKGLFTFAPTLPLATVFHNAYRRKALPVDKQLYAGAKAIVPPNGFVFCDWICWHYHAVERNCHRKEHPDSKLYQDSEPDQIKINIVCESTKGLEWIFQNIAHSQSRPGTYWTREIEGEWMVMTRKAVKNDAKSEEFSKVV